MYYTNFKLHDFIKTLISFYSWARNSKIKFSVKEKFKGFEIFTHLLNSIHAFHVDKTLIYLLNTFQRPY